MALVGAVGLWLLIAGGGPPAKDAVMVFDLPSADRAGAALSVDDANVPIPAAGTLEQPCAAGTHHFVATRPCYQPIDKTVLVEAGQHLAVPLEWKPKAILAIDWPSDQRSGAELRIDAQLRPLPAGQQFEIAMEPGTHVVRASATDRKTFETSVAMALDQRQDVTVAMPFRTTLVVNWPTTERGEGATFKLDDEIRALPEGATIELPIAPGRHSIQLRRSGFQPFDQIVEVGTEIDKPVSPVWTPAPTRVAEAAPNTAGASSVADSKPSAPIGAAGTTKPPDDKRSDVAQAHEESTNSAKKQPIPSAEEQQPIVKQLDELYPATHSAKDLEKAQEVYALAEKAKPGSTEQYVLWDRGILLAAEGGDPTLSFQGIDAMAAKFAVDPLDAKQKLLDRIGKGAISPDRVGDLVSAARLLVDQAVSDDRFDQALSIIATEGRLYSKKSVDAEFRRDADKALAVRRNEIKSLQNEWEGIERARQTLQSNPGDAEANLTVGRWLCFRKADWAQGLPLLAKGSDGRLKSLAARELEPALDAAARVHLADGWWDWASGRPATLGDPAKIHAGELYTEPCPKWSLC